MTYIVSMGVAVEGILSDLHCFYGSGCGGNPQWLTLFLWEWLLRESSVTYIVSMGVAVEGIFSD